MPVEPDPEEDPPPAPVEAGPEPDPLAPEPLPPADPLPPPDPLPEPGPVPAVLLDDPRLSVR